MNMEFLYANYINTTTVASTTTGTGTVAQLIDRYTTKYYESSGDNSDLTITTLHLTFPSPKVVNRIVMQNVNLKAFGVYPDTVTNAAFTLTGAATNSSAWAQNSTTNLYLVFPTQTVSAIVIRMSATMVANSEKKIGELWISQRFCILEDNPSAKDYKVARDRKEFVHTMSDGGTAVYVVDDKLRADIKIDYVSASMTSLLSDLHGHWEEFIFVPFPTTTGWDSKIYEVVWTGDFDFEEYTDNYKGNGFVGTMRLRETAR